MPGGGTDSNGRGASSHIRPLLMGASKSNGSWARRALSVSVSRRLAYPPGTKTVGHQTRGVMSLDAKSPQGRRAPSCFKGFRAGGTASADGIVPGGAIQESVVGVAGFK